MKKEIIVASVSIFSLLPVPEFAEPAIESRTVYALPALNVRLHPGPSAPIIGSIPSGRSLRIPTSKDTPDTIIDGLPGRWRQIDFQGKPGYIFDGYLANLPPAPAECSSLRAYLQSHYDLTSPSIAYFTYDSAGRKRPIQDFDSLTEEAKMEAFKSQKWSLRSGIVFEDTTAWEAGYQSLHLPGRSIKDALLLMKVCTNTPDSFEWPSLSLTETQGYNTCISRPGDYDLRIAINSRDRGVTIDTTEIIGICEQSSSAQLRLIAL